MDVEHLGLSDQEKAGLSEQEMALYDRAMKVEEVLHYLESGALIIIFLRIGQFLEQIAR